MDVVVRQVQMRQGGEGGEDQGVENLEVVDTQVEVEKIVNREVNIFLRCS